MNKQILQITKKAVENYLKNNLFSEIEKEYKKSGLNISSGNLLKSFIIGNTNNIYNFSIKQEEISFEYGSKLVYFNVLENGATYSPSLKQKKFFWAKYYETNNIAFKAMALSKTIKIKSHHFYKRAMQNVMKNMNEVVAQEIIKNFNIYG